MNGFNSEKIERDAYISSIMVGNCPKCNSNNTHSCSAPEEIPEHEHDGSKIPKRISGSDCPIALRIDDISVGHCDSCGHIWCLECENKLSEEKYRCGHWGVCSECPNEPTEFSDSAKQKCPYEFEIANCPKIIEWKKEEIEKQAS